MKTLFNMDDCRYLSDTQLIYDITNNKETAVQYEECIKQNEEFSLDTLFQELTPGRKKVARAAIEMYKRSLERSQKGITIKLSKDIYNVMHPVLADVQHEEFWIILLNQAMKIIRKIRLSTGGIAGTYVDVRLLIKYAVLHNAVSVAVVHNHPSGNVTPSIQDTSLTRVIKNALDTMQINLVDHVIIGANNFHSYADKGEL